MPYINSTEFISKSRGESEMAEMLGKDFLNVFATVSGSIQSSYQSPNTGSGDIVYFNTQRIYNFKNPYMGKAFGTSSAQRKPNFGIFRNYQILFYLCR